MSSLLYVHTGRSYNLDPNPLHTSLRGYTGSLVLGGVDYGPKGPLEAFSQPGPTKTVGVGGLEDIFAMMKGALILDPLSGSLTPPGREFSTSDHQSCGPCSGSGQSIQYSTTMQAILITSVHHMPSSSPWYDQLNCLINRLVLFLFKLSAYIYLLWIF